MLGVAGALFLVAVEYLDDGGGWSAFALVAVALLAVTSAGALLGSRFLAQRRLGISAIGTGLAVGYLILEMPFVAQADGRPPIRSVDGPMLSLATVVGIVLCGSAALLAGRARSQKAWPWEEGTR